MKMTDHQNGQGCSVPVVDHITSVVRADILAKTHELANIIMTSREIEFYRQAEQKVNDNEHVQELISLIKKRQKEAVAFESFQNKKMVEKIEGEISSLQDELDSIPVVNEFQQAQKDINDLLQLIMKVISDSVSEKINIENGADVPVQLNTCSD
jgi:cell fate (sporulation/competence/biofilm development) regulator YmcA (YheA/YmcA/DUF963 family)